METLSESVLSAPHEGIVKMRSAGPSSTKLRGSPREPNGASGRFSFRLVHYGFMMIGSSHVFVTCLALVVGHTAYAANTPLQRGNSIPVFDIRAACHALALVPEAHIAEIDQADATRHCLDEENEARAQLLKEWSQFTLAEQRACVGVSHQRVVDPDYSELLTCLELARDAHKPVSNPQRDLPEFHSPQKRLGHTALLP